VPTAPQQVEALRMVATALEDPVLADVAERLDAGVATAET
jgi:hypothetical protein